MLFVALVLYRNRLLLVKRARNPSKDTWELPSIEITQKETEVDVQQKFKSQIGIYINPYLIIDSYNDRHANNKITLYKCSLLSDPAALSINSDYSGYLWTYISGTSQITFAPPHDDIIKFLSIDKYVISSKTAGAYFHQSGLASMDKETRSKIARLGGKAAHAMGRAHKWTPEAASKAGKLGVMARKASKFK